MRPDRRCALNTHNQQRDRSHERLGRQARKSVQGSVFVDANLDEERITSGLPVTREQRGSVELVRSLMSALAIIHSPTNRAHPWDTFLFAEAEPDWIYLFTTVTTDGSGLLHAGVPSCFS
jgi:hypothetical protein